MDAAESLQTRLEAGEITLEEAARQHSAPLRNASQPFTRRVSDSSIIPPSFASGIFSLQREGDIHIAPTENQNEVAIIQLASIDRPTPQELSALTETSVPQLRQQLSSDLLEAFVADIQKAVDLEVNPQAIEAYKARVNPDT